MDLPAPRRHLLPFALSLAAVAFASADARADRGDDASDPRSERRAEACEEVSFQVSLAPGDPASYRVVGELCGRAQHRTLQLLLHGATYNRDYWDFPEHPELYSYVRYARAAGFATLALDRLGAGASDHPPGAAVTVTASAYAVHQVISALRAGTAIGGDGKPIRFDRIVLVGHSFGSFISWMEAGTYGDIDGLIVSGASHVPDPPGAGPVQASLLPASFDPRFAGLPADYFTTAPGTRGSNFYYLPNVSPSVLALDEATKDVVPLGHFFDQTVGYGLTPNIHVPVLGVVGNFDTLSCVDGDCAASGSFAHEKDYYAPDACFTSVVIPQAGHDLNLHRNAPLWFLAAQAWAATRVGVHSNHSAPAPCR
jgi:pimeloyl-ACP methyl ester carboxylesterase